MRVAAARGVLALGLALALASAAALAGCGADDAEGSLTLTVSGEEGAREGFPFEVDGERVELVDGWSVRFSTYLVALGELELERDGQLVELAPGQTFVADVSKGVPELLTYEGLQAQRWQGVHFAIRPPGQQVVNLNGVAADDLARMEREQLTYLIRGVATRGDRSLQLEWAFAAPVKMRDCTNGVDGTQGVVIPPNGRAQAELTIHVDHAFFDALGSEVSGMRFEAIAAASSDGERVTWEDLKRQSLTDLRGVDGQPLRDAQGKRIIYNPGSAQLQGTTLQDFLRFSFASQAHLNGEGLCTQRRWP